MISPKLVGIMGEIIDSLFLGKQRPVAITRHENALSLVRSTCKETLHRPCHRIAASESPSTENLKTSDS